MRALVGYPWSRPAPWRELLTQENDPEGDPLFVEAVIDLRRAFDLLAARTDVEGIQLGYVGHNFGAQWGAILSAVESRLKAVVLMVWVPDQVCIWWDNDDPGIAARRAHVPKEKQDTYLKACEWTGAVRYVPHAEAFRAIGWCRRDLILDMPDHREGVCGRSTCRP